MTIRIDQFGNRDIQIDPDGEWLRIYCFHRGPGYYGILTYAGNPEDDNAWIVNKETLREIRDEITRVLGDAPKRGGLLR